MVVVNKTKTPQRDKEEKTEEQSWENPSNPEKAFDARDIEQLQRQKKAAEIRKDNLSDTGTESN